MTTKTRRSMALTGSPPCDQELEELCNRITYELMRRHPDPSESFEDYLLGQSPEAPMLESESITWERGVTGQMWAEVVAAYSFPGSSALVYIDTSCNMVEAVLDGRSCSTRIPSQLSADVAATFAGYGSTC